MSNSSSDSGCGCVGFILFILVMWSLFFGLPVGPNIYHIDIFPPAIRVEANLE